MKNSKLTLLGFLHALGITVYVALVALIMQNGEKIFGKMSNFFGPVAFLLLFVLSAAVTGALALARPLVMYLENKKTEAMKMFCYTISWLFILTLLALLLQLVK